MKKILVPTDFSQNSIDALHYAKAIVEQTGGQLYILAGYEKPYSSSSALRSLRNRLEKDAIAKMESLTEQLNAEESQVPFETFVREGNPVELILNASEQLDVDMIVMGTKGSSGLEEIVIGSVTSQVIAKAPRPVLGVPRNAFFFGFKRVTLATDLQKGSYEAAQQLIDLTAPFNSIIDLLHVFDPGTEAPGEKLAAMDERLEKTDREVHNFLVAHESIPDGLLQHMSNHPSEALVMLTRRRGLLAKLFDPSMTKKVVTHAKTPFIALHQK